MDQNFISAGCNVSTVVEFVVVVKTERHLQSQNTHVRYEDLAQTVAMPQEHLSLA